MEDTTSSADRLNALLDDPEADATTIEALLPLFGLIGYDNPEAFQVYCERMLALAERLGDERSMAYSLGYLGYAYYLRSAFEEALRLLRKARALLRPFNDTYGMALITGAMASVQTSLGNYEQALTQGLNALQGFREAGDPIQEAWCLQSIGTSYQAFGNPERAHEYHAEAFAIFELLDADTSPEAASPQAISRAALLRPEQELSVGRARALSGIGTALQSLGQHAKALPYHERALVLFREANNRLGEARALNDLGRISQKLGDFPDALDHLRQSLTLREAIGNRQAQSTSLIDLGALYLEQDDRFAARQALTRALRIAEDIGSKPRAYQAHAVLSQLYQREGSLEKALHHYKRFHDIKQAVFGEETGARIRHIQITAAMEQAEREAELTRVKNEELRVKNEQLEVLLEELQSTQRQLIESEKMASLGALTAGIAHEIKNPLNFITNFARLTAEIADELNEELEANASKPVGEVADYLKDLLDDLKLNVLKIEEHGRRADSIVQSMLLHTRGQDGEPVPTALNALVEEYVNLSYHGMRAQEPSFNVTIERDYGADVDMVPVIPQTIGRVLLNLLHNAFQATDERRETGSDPAYTPLIRVKTARTESGVEIALWDNGGGIPPEVRERIFEPFVTTKPAGRGTGLGLSISYDIITQGHGGTLEVETEEGDFTCFTIHLPDAD